MTAEFDAALAMLGARAQQILGYHRITRDNVGPEETIAHFTSWAACLEMLKQAVEANEGLTTKRAYPLELWASDVSCLNDTLEGKALRSFAHRAAAARTPSCELSPSYQE